ncbi:hypothetical protein DPMN_157099 [Dreissena polymorpha]|uniref:Uncharacterized protein n=1 Tax=Dreissena polymorpha TaxID=45954 RepID=A0A9D4IPP3_DREPO|nr:hypothetical protein DPMN_157099 [Dreissena polymorpha]
MHASTIIRLSGGSGHNVTRAPSHGGATTSAHVATSSGPRCHQCTGATDPHYCSMVVQCNPDEVACYLRFFCSHIIVLT